ncbi:hypothetical protein [Salinispora cortesiana]|uniref:hypothetical protein n=1 Tax=Salinispora cortesiana TaxID=1305843 RepID=UPI0003FDE79E
MAVTQNDQTGGRKRSGLSAEAKAVAELARAAKQGLSLTGSGERLKQLTRTVLEAALNPGHSPGGDLVTVS